MTGADIEIRRLAGFARPERIIEAAVAGLRRERMRVSEAAERYRRLNNRGSYVGPWRNDLAPYLVEPMDAIGDRAVEMGVLVGPSQFGKTEVLLSAIAWAGKVRPADMLVYFPTKDLAADFSARRIDEKLLAASPELRAELGESRGDDKTFQKVFRNGSIVTLAWPTSSQVSSRPVPIILVDERDSMADQIGDEGDPVHLMRQRRKTFGSNGVVFVTSSPKRLTHSGIMPLYQEGDRRLWYWPCPECGEFFAPGFDLDRRPLNRPSKGAGGIGGLHWPAGCSPEEARAAVVLICPHCGSAIEERSRSAMNDRATWLPEGVSIGPDGTMTGRPRPGRVRSWWFCGIASNFASWGDLAFNYRAAELDLVERGDEAALRTVTNTDFGFPFEALAEDARPIEAEDLADRADASDYRLGTVPAGVDYLVATVDVQGDRFEVAVWGFDRKQSSALVDRYAIRQEADGRTDIAPATRPEQWDLLQDRVLGSRYPLAGNARKGLPVGLLAVDTGGLEGVTANAYQWFVRAVSGSRSRKPIDRARLVLVKGDNRASGPLVRLSPIDRVARGRSVTVDLHILNVSELKTIIHRRLRRDDDGPTSIRFPVDAPAHVFAELAAERRVAGKWERRGANETLDLAAYAAGVAHKLRAHLWRRRPWFCTPVALELETGGLDPLASGDDLAADAGPIASPVAVLPSSPEGKAERGGRPQRRRRRGVAPSTWI